MSRAALLDGSRLAWKSACERVALGAEYVSPRPPPLPIMAPPVPTPEGPDVAECPPPAAVTSAIAVAATSMSTATNWRFRLIFDSFRWYMVTLLRATLWSDACANRRLPPAEAVCPVAALGRGPRRRGRPRRSSPR